MFSPDVSSQPVARQMTSRDSNLCVVGDVHGHLQLALVAAALWQRELEQVFDMVLLAGDVGAFTDERQLDKATLRHAFDNPCELEFLRQWASVPPEPALERIFTATASGGLGLECPVVMVHGNHEGHSNLAALSRQAGAPPPEPVEARGLPTVDTGGRLHFLPGGWRVMTSGGTVVGGVGGIQPGQRPKARYHPHAYLNEDSVLALLEAPPVDVLVTHQGPARVQGSDRGSELLDPLLGHARIWLHGHSVADSTIQQVSGTRIVPLFGIPFEIHGPRRGQPGNNSWCHVHLTSDRLDVSRGRPQSWRELHRGSWVARSDRQLLCPHLAG